MDYKIEDNKIIINNSQDNDTVQYVYNTIQALSGVLESEEWQSRYNRYVIYDYEPFNADCFKLVITLKSGLVHNDFILFHLNQQLKNVEHLEKCLTI